MKQKILLLLGEKNAARIEKKIVELGRPEVFANAEIMAKEELGEAATEEQIVERAAIRTQQLLGCIVRQPAPTPAPAPQSVSTAPASPVEASKGKAAPLPRKVGQEAQGATEEPAAS